MISQHNTTVQILDKLIREEYTKLGGISVLPEDTPTLGGTIYLSELPPSTRRRLWLLINREKMIGRSKDKMKQRFSGDYQRRRIDSE